MLTAITTWENVNTTLNIRSVTSGAKLLKCLFMCQTSFNTNKSVESLHRTLP